MGCSGYRNSKGATNFVKIADIQIAALISGALIMFAGFGVWAWQGIYWLHYGFWRSFTVLDAAAAMGISIDLSHITWIGVAKAILWALHQSLGAAVIVLGICTIIFAAALEDA